MLGGFLKSIFGTSERSEFPPNPVDGQEYTDAVNGKWRYSAATKQWARLLPKPAAKSCHRHSCGCHEPAETGLVELVDLPVNPDGPVSLILPTEEDKKDDTGEFVMGVDPAIPGGDQTVVTFHSMSDMVVPATTITSPPVESYSAPAPEAPSSPPASDPSPPCGGGDYSGGNNDYGGGGGGGDY